MKRTLPLLMQVLLAGLILIVAGCKQPMKPMKFSNTIARGTGRLSDGGKKFYKAASTGDAAATQSAYSELQTALADVKKEFDEMNSPVKSAPGSDLQAKAREFMQAEQAIFDQCITPILDIVKNSTQYPDVNSKKAAMAPFLSKATELEAPVFDSIKKSHEDYCKHHNLQAKSQP